MVCDGKGPKITWCLVVVVDDDDEVEAVKDQLTLNACLLKEAQAVLIASLAYIYGHVEDALLYEGIYDTSNAWKLW